jgi:hypothetical protein
MNSAKKVLVNFRKPRSVYDRVNEIYRRRYNPSNMKEEKRMLRRMKKTNIYDPDNTGEQIVETFTPPKMKVVQRILTDVFNNHRLTRTPMPKDVKEEYIKKCKEFSLFKINEWRHYRHEQMNFINNEYEMLKSSAFLPLGLMYEIFDPEDVMYDTEDLDGDPVPIRPESEDNAPIEYTDLLLYGDQALKIFPDDYHIIFKTMLNSNVYEKGSKVPGQEGEGEEGDMEVESIIASESK